MYLMLRQDFLLWTGNMSSFRLVGRNIHNTFRCLFYYTTRLFAAVDLSFIYSTALNKALLNI